MIVPLFARVPVAERGLRTRIEVRSDAARHIRSQALDWPGLLLEAGRNYVTGADAAALAHHYIGLNAGTRPVVLRGVEPDRDVTLAPGTAWFVPAGDPVTFRVESLHMIVRMTIDPRHADRLLEEVRGEGSRLELRRAYGIDTPQLRHLLMALVAEADAGTSTGVAFVETLAAGVSQQVALHAGAGPAPRERARGGLSPGARRRVLELIDAQLDARLRVDTLAREVGLSSAHFARAFKQTLGEAPHRFLLSRRLERARRLLEACGVQLSDVAARVGFADQAHFTRHFKRQFGVTPGAVARANGRCA